METLRRYSGLPFSTDPREAGSTLLKLIQQNGISQTELAERTGIQPQAICRAIATGRGLSAGRWKLLADALGVSVESIFGLQRVTPQ